MGHIKRFCKEEVYCKYCKIGTHSTTACRTYPATSSRKNTPEKRTQEDIDQEVNRRVQKDLLRILTGLATNRQIDVDLIQAETSNQAANGNNLYRHIPERTKEVQSLIGEFQRPADVAEREQNVGDSGQGKMANSQEPILNQQWDERLQLQPPLRPTNAGTSQTTGEPLRSNLTTGASTTTSTAASATRQQVDTLVDARQGQRTNTPGADDIQSNMMRPTVTQPNLVTPATNRRVEEVGCTQCSCRCQHSGNTHSINHSTTQSQRYNLHTDYEDGGATMSNFLQGKETNR